jgi:S1/P1 Nuclease
MASTSRLGYLLFIAIFTLVSPVYSWGSLGHRTVAYVAEKYLTPSAASFTANLLENEDISEAAIWADELKIAHCRGWQHTKPWHFIDARVGFAIPIQYPWSDLT